MDKFIELIKLFIQTPSLLIVPIVLVFVTHWFAKKRKTDELLFNSRKKIYSKFISEYGSGFSDISSKLETLMSTVNHREIKSDHDTVSTFFEIKKVKDKHDYKAKVCELFSNCRLVAGRALERKLRHFYELISEDIEGDWKGTNRYRYLMGYEIEAFMRYDLKVISIFELLLWRIYINFKRIKLKKLEKEKKDRSHNNDSI